MLLVLPGLTVRGRWEGDQVHGWATATNSLPLQVLQMHGVQARTALGACLITHYMKRLLATGGPHGTGAKG